MQIGLWKPEKGTKMFYEHPDLAVFVMAVGKTNLAAFGNGI